MQEWDCVQQGTLLDYVPLLSLDTNDSKGMESCGIDTYLMGATVVPRYNTAVGAATPNGNPEQLSKPGFTTPPPPLTQAQACPSTVWALNRCFQDFLGPLFLLVLNAALGACDTLVEGTRGSFMSVIVHSVHYNIVPHIATPCCLF